jgi:ATP-dependent DNA ligase
MYDLAPIIVGWSDPEGTRPHLGALLLGYYTDDGKLIYAGRVGTGMPVALRSAIRKMMKIAATAAFEAIIVIGALKDNGRRDYTLNSTTWSHEWGPVRSRTASEPRGIRVDNLPS